MFSLLGFEPCTVQPVTQSLNRLPEQVTVLSKKKHNDQTKNIQNLYQRKILGFHVSEYSDDGIFCDGVQSGRYTPMIWWNLLSPCTGYKHWFVSSELHTDNLEDRDSLKPHLFALNVEAHMSSSCSAERRAATPMATKLLYYRQ